MEPAHSAAPYKSIALAPLPSRPEVAPLNGRSVSHTILPSVHSSTSIAENVQRSTRPILPQSYSTTALPTEPSNFVSRFATGPIRIIRPAPMIQDDGGDPDGFMYGQPVFGGPSRPTQHLGHGRKPIGPARRVVTAPTPSKEVLGYPTRTPAANRILSRNIRDKVEEMEEQPVPVLSNLIDPITPVLTRKVVEETPPRLTKVESPLLPVLPPDVEDVRDTSMLEPINARELESPVPVEIAAMVPLPDEVDAGFEDATPTIDTEDELEQMVDEESVLRPAVIESTHEVESAMDEPTSTADEETEGSAIDLQETKPFPTTSHDQSPSVTEPKIDEEPVESVAPVGEIASLVLSLILDQGPNHVSMPDESISTNVHVPTTSDDDTHVSRSTMDEVDAVALSTDKANVKASLKDENPAPVVSEEEEQLTTSPLIEEDTAEPVAPGVTNITDQDHIVENVKLEATPAIVVETPASFTEEDNPLPRLPDSPTRIMDVVSEIVSESLVQVVASKVVDAEVVEDTSAAPAPVTMEIADDISAASTATQIIEDLPVAPASEQIADHIPSAPISMQIVENLPVAPASKTIEADIPATPAPTQIVEDIIVAPTSRQTPEQVLAPIPYIQDQEVAPPKIEIDNAVEVAPSLPVLNQLPIQPERILDQADTSIPDVQSKAKAPSVIKVNPVTRAPSRFAQSRPPVKAVQTVKPTSAPASAPVSGPPRKPSVPKAAAISRPIKPVERKTFRPVTAAQTAAAASLAKVRNAQAVAQAEAAKPRVPSASISKPAAVEPRSRVASAASSSSLGVTAASTKTTSTTNTAPAPIAKTTQSRLLAPTKASASRAAPTISQPSIKVATSVISSNPALPPVRKEKIKLKAALPSFRPVRNAVRSTSGPGTGTWIAPSTSKPIPRAAAISLPHSPVSTNSGAKPASIAQPSSPVVIRPETMALPPSPTSCASRNVHIIQPALQPLPASPPPVAADVPLPDSPISQASQLRFRVIRAASPAISALQARLATPSRNSSAPTMSDEESDSEGEDETSGVTFKVKSDGRPSSGLKMKMKLKQGGNGDLMEFSAPARMEKVWIGSTTPMYTPGRKALVIRDANLASPLVRKVINQE